MGVIFEDVDILGFIMTAVLQDGGGFFRHFAILSRFRSNVVITLRVMTLGEFLGGS
jgi:hypothetical protein